MEKVKRENIGEFLFQKELEIIGATRLMIVDSDNWRAKFPMSRNQYSEFRDYAIKLMMKTFRCNKNKASETFNWYWMQFGVKITQRS
jgi:hypothetical protein